MLSVPHRAQDDKFTNSIEGFRGNIHKLGRLIAHDWFSVTLGDTTKERYLFLFKTRLLVSKVRRISDDRSVFQLKDIIRLEQVEIKDQLENVHDIELSDKIGGQSLVLKSHKDNIKELWLKELRNLVSEAATEVSAADDLQIISGPASPPTESVKKKQKVLEGEAAENKPVLNTVVSSTSEEGTVSATIVGISEVLEGNLDDKTSSKADNNQLVSECLLSKSEESTKKFTQSVKSFQVKSLKSESLKADVQQDKVNVATSITSVVETKKAKNIQKAVQDKSDEKEPKAISTKDFEKDIRENHKETTEEEIKVVSEVISVHPEVEKAKVEYSKAETTVKVETSTKGKVKTVEGANIDVAKDKLETKVPDKEIKSDIKLGVIQKEEQKASEEDTKSTSENSLNTSAVLASACKGEVPKKLELKPDEVTKKEIEQKEINKSEIVKKENIKLEESTEYLSKEQTEIKEVSSDLHIEFSDKKTTAVVDLKDDLTKDKGEVKQADKVYEQVTLNQEVKSPPKSKKEEDKERGIVTKQPKSKKVEEPPKKVKKAILDQNGAKVPDPLFEGSKPAAKFAVVETSKKQDEPVKPNLVNSQVSKVTVSAESVDQQVTGIALRKSVEKQKLFEEGSVISAEVNLNIVDQDIMSRKYESAYGTTDAYGEATSYSRSTVRQSAYSSDSGLTSTSRYGAEALATSKYGPEGGASALTGKYGAEASVTTKYGTETSARSGRFSSDSLGSSKYDEITSKYGIRGVSSESDNGSLSYGRKSLALESKGEYTSKYSRGISDDSDKYDVGNASYTKKSYLDNKESKYDELASRYGRGLSSDSEAGSSYTRKSYSIDTKAGGESKYEDYSSKYIGNASIESDKDTSAYKRRNLSLDSSEPELSNYSRKYVKSERRSLVDLGENGSSYRRKNRAGIDEEIDNTGDIYISKQNTRSQISIEEDFDADAYIAKIKSRNGADNSADTTSSYKRQRSIKTNIDEERDTGADVHVSKRTSKSQISIEEDLDPEAYISKVKSRNENVDDNNHSYRRTISKEEDKEETYKRSISQNEDENRLAKFEKYSRKSSDVSEQLETPSGKYKRTDSNSSASRESYEILTETTVNSEKVKSQSIEEAAEISKKADKKSQAMAPPDKKQKLTKTDGGIKESKDPDLKKAGFIVKLKDTELLEDTYLRFMIKVKGDPHPTLTFFKNGVQISEKDKRVSINRDRSDNDFYELVIPDVKTEDAGIYKCTAKNEHGEESTEAKVTITSSKHLFDDLADKDGPLPAGEKPSFIWKRDGIEFEPEERFKVLMGDDQDSLALIFQHVKPEDAGMYTCVAQTSAGHISCSAELTVQGQVYELHRDPEKPQLIIEKKEALTTTGGSCMVEMKCLGFPKPKITIKHNGIPVDAATKYKFMYDDDENVALIIKNVEPADAGKYEIIAENELGRDTQDVNLTVKQRPKLKSKMLDTSAPADQPLKMTLEIEGIPKPTIQFLKDGKPIENNEHMKVIQDGDKYNIVIDKANLGDSGKYAVVLKNELAETTEAWDLNVYCAPKLIRGLAENKIVELKEQVELSIQIESSPEAEITWYKDGQEITSNEHLIINRDGDTYKLKISGAVSTDSASYKVKAKNIHGSVESECRVDVKRKPTITSELQNMTVLEGDKDVTFYLKLDAFPKPTIKWYLDEVEILESRSEFTRYETTDGAKLVIKEVNHTLSGRYTCKLLNDLGETSSSAKLTVHCKPRIIKQLKDTIIEEGATLHLEVEVDCCPEASEVKWLMNGKEVSADVRITITRDKQRLENYHLTVNLVKYEDQGEYEVYVTNAIGTVTSKSTVTVQTIPKILDTNMRDGLQYESLDVSYMVKGWANPPPTAMWSLNGNEIKSDSNVRMSVGQNGEEFKLDIVKLGPKDAGLYECKLSNPVGNVKQQAKLEVIPEAELRRPKVKDGMGLVNQDVMKNKPATLTAVIIGDPIPDVTWLLNGKEIIPEEIEKHGIFLEARDVLIENGLKETTFSLSIPRCERDNGGKYTIRAKNKWGVIESSGVLNVLMAPEIDGPEYAKVIPGEPSELVCVVKSNPPAVVTWSKSENVLQSGNHIILSEDLASETYKLSVVSTQVSDEGYYKVFAKNKYGQSEAEGKIRLINEGPSCEMPKFITGLQDALVEHGGEISLMVRADGVPKPDLNWYHNDKLIENAPEIKYVHTSDRQVACTYNITNWNPNNNGVYKVTATNSAGNVETSAKINMVQSPPVFRLRMDRSKELNEGESLILRASVIGSPKPSVAWVKDGKILGPENDRIKMEYGPDGSITLKIDEVKPADSGSWKLIVKNPNGDINGVCAVVVTRKSVRPRFTKCIKDTKVALGEPLRLSAKVTGYPAPDIKWIKDGAPVRPSANLHLEHNPDGSIALVVDSLRPEHAGKYFLIVGNKLGDITGEAKVEIEKRQTKPEFVVKLYPQTVVEGFPAKFEVKAVGFPAPDVSWFRNGIEVISDAKHIKMKDLPDGTSYLLLDACDLARDGLNYKATATNDAGETSTSAPLTVILAMNIDEPEEKPMLLDGLKDVTTDEGSELKLEAQFTGNPIPAVQWAKDGITIEADERVIIKCDGKKIGLLIDYAISSDAGTYSISLTNPFGTDRSEAKASVLKVYSPPTFTQKLVDLQQLQNRDAKHVLRVFGVPPPEVTWTKDGELLRESNKYHIKQDGDVYTLCITNCGLADEGIYKATATNQEGEDSCQAKLEIVKEIKTCEKIEPPYFVKRIGDTELYKNMTARFTACAAGIPEPNVEWYLNDGKLYPSERIRMERDLAGLLRLSISNVNHTDLGKYSCKIYNEHGNDICHAELRFDDGVPHAKSKRAEGDYIETGDPMALADPPIISRMTDRHCTLSWKPSIPGGPRPPVTYQIEMLEMPDGEWFTVRSGIRSCVCDVGNLIPFRDYKFRIRVENQYGISDPSPYALTHREKLEPDPPRFIPYLPPGIDFRPETSPYFPRDFDIDRPPRDNISHAPIFLRQEQSTQYGVKNQNCNLFWFVYGYPKPTMQYYFNDELIEPGGRFDWSYTRNGQATLFINKMLDRDIGFYEAVATNEHGTARQRVRLEIAEMPTFVKRPNIEYVMVRNQAKFEAKILGVPYPDVKWYKDWKPLASSSRIKIQFIEPDTHILTITEAIYKDEGLYSVSARNVAGSTSASAMLYVDENDLEYNLHTYKPCNPVRLKKRPLIGGYDLGDELGRGTQGVTYHAVERANGRNYAAKIMHGRGDLKPMMHNELDILNQLRHQRLISLHDSYEHEDQLALILELAAGGELVKDYLIKRDYYTESDIAGFIKQILLGLDYMHSNAFAHLSLDIGDLLLTHPGSNELKITDFSLSRRIAMGRLAPLKFGMPEYVSPECANGEGVGLGHDMWSVGIITYILLSGISPFRGANDMETLQKIQSGKWMFEESWWCQLSIECRDFITKLLVYQADGRMDVHAALRHPWLDRSKTIRSEEYKISTKYLREYYSLYKEWYDVANCRLWFKRKALECAFKHPSKMIYIPGERFTPPPGEPRERKPFTWEEKIPSRSPLNYEIGMFKSESHYQNGPDTYLLQLRDVDFPCRLREYMKVAATRGPGSYILSDENGYDWRTPIIRERRRFTDIMDEEIDDERKSRINRYGSGDSSHTIRRLRHEVGSRLDTYVEAEAFLESKHEGRLPFFREKPQLAAMQEGREVKLSCLAVGEPKPVVQWFKNDAILAESSRIRIETDDAGRSQLILRPALGFDLGMYKVVARNKIGQTIARTRIVYGTVSDPPDSPSSAQISSNEVLLTWRQPRNDGHAPIICYSLQYKLADDSEWIEQARNIDQEFYYMRGLKEGQNYVFRLAAKNSMGWSDQGEASGVILTHPAGAAKVQLSRAMMHLQQITDAGAEPQEESQTTLDYTVESTPIEWEQANVKDKFSFVSELARGKFSTVMKAIDNETDNLVVVKAIDVPALTLDHLEGEFAAIRSLRHERIVAMLAAYKSDEMAAFVLEKLQGSDVLTYLASRQEYTEQTVATIVTQILDGLQYLHWRGLCHLDLQPDNIVMCGVRSVQVKLVDLGSAHRVTKLGNNVPVVGHPDYMCPEILAEEPAFPQSDIWSIGVLTYVMLSGTLPFRGADENETRQNILFVRYRFEHLYKEVSQESVRFVMLLFKRHANKRPSAEECHENRWLLPTDHMIRKRERAVFLGNKLKEYSEEYHAEKSKAALTETSALAGKNVLRSQSVQEELETATT